MAHLLVGLRAAFLLASLMLVVSFYRLAAPFWYRAIRGRRTTMTVHRFGFAVWISAMGAILANVGHIVQALGLPQVVATDVTTAIGLTLMSLGYFMHVSSKIEANGGNVRRFLIYGGGGVVLVGALCAFIPIIV